MSKSKRWAVLSPVVTPTENDIAWSAGFVEGDGHIGKNGTTGAIEVTQKEEWTLRKLQAFWGGSLGTIRKQGISRNRSYYRWRVSGGNARHLAFSIRKYMSPTKNLQIAFLLGEVKFARYTRQGDI